MSPPGSILLVGEGNFSFAASLSRRRGAPAPGVTATCPQGEEEALRQEGASGNIQDIRSTGGEVLFGVDCTRLGECAPLQGRSFELVVFNFPHCGRKSGVKKNRDLLKSFFLSCVQVLAEDGEVHVSLCNGQGGTPADQPRRERHNSWQVVAMAAEARLVLVDVRPFESQTHQSYKCTGYRSQDKGFHVEKALVHVFARSPLYAAARALAVQETVDGRKVEYRLPAELGDYVFRGFLSADSVHPVRLAQDFLREGLAETCSLRLATESAPLLLSPQRLRACRHGVDAAHWYWVRGAEGGAPEDAGDSGAGQAGEEDREAASEEGVGVYVLRPSLLPQVEELSTQRAERDDGAGWDEGNGERDERTHGGHNGVHDSAPSLFGTSGLVFRNVPIGPWAPPSFHQLVVKGVFPSEPKPMALLGQRLESLLGPYGVSLVEDEGALSLTAKPTGVVGSLRASDGVDGASVTVRLNLDLLAALLFSLPDWRLLWSRDPRFLKRFALRPPPGEAFRPLSLFPEQISFDISFWTGPAYEETGFHAAVREASCGTVERVKLVDRFSHPELSQTSYCYRLTYRSHTHALSHSQALHFHKRLESLLSSRLQVTTR